MKYRLGRRCMMPMVINRDESMMLKAIYIFEATNSRAIDIDDWLRAPSILENHGNEKLWRHVTYFDISHDKPSSLWAKLRDYALLSLREEIKLHYAWKPLKLSCSIINQTQVLSSIMHIEKWKYHEPNEFRRGEVSDTIAIKGVKWWCWR